MTTLIDTTLYQLAIDLQQTRKEQKALKEKEDQIKVDIHRKLDDVETTDFPLFVCDDAALYPGPSSPVYKIDLVPVTRKTLDSKLLLANGVAPDVLGKSMSVSSYTRLDVKEDKP